MLTYAQISPDRLTIGDATSRLDEHDGVLGVALAQWAARDDTKAEPKVRRRRTRPWMRSTACCVNCTRSGRAWSARSGKAMTSAPPGSTRCSQRPGPRQP